MPLKNGRTTAALQAIVVGNTIPAGVIQAFGGGTVPTGWLLCDGSVVDRTTYSGLYASIGDVNGNGNGTTTFHLPDLRGRFVRGADNMGTGAAGRDPNVGTRIASNAGGATGAGVGSVQDDAFQSHAHISGMYALDSRFDVYASRSVAAGSSYGSTNGSSLSGVTSFPIQDNNSGGTGGVPRFTSETRPQNANTAYIIKV
jgi:microcystin-dependent protein